LQEAQQQRKRSSSSMMVWQAVRPHMQVVEVVLLLLWALTHLQEHLLCGRRPTTAVHRQQQQHQVLKAAVRMVLVWR
jgi:hypothetical protein